MLVCQDKGVNVNKHAPPPPYPHTPILIADHLSHTYPGPNGGVLALDDVSFEIGAEQFVCIVGPT